MTPRRRIIPAALLVIVSAAAPVHAADAEKGKALYAGRCAFCHGSVGKGDGPAAAALNPPPTDLTTAVFWKTAKPAIITDTIANGKAGTAMVRATACRVW